MRTEMVVKKDNIKNTFNFLEANAWFLANSQNYHYLRFGEGGVEFSFGRTDITGFLTSDSKHRIRKHVILSDTKLPMHCYWDKSNVCLDGAARKYEIVQYLRSSIATAEASVSSLIIPSMIAKRMQVLNEYAKLLRIYEQEMIKEYNSKTEEEKIALIDANPDVIFVLENPSLELQKEAIKSYKSNKKTKRDYSNIQYNKVLREVRDEGKNLDEEEILIEVMRKNPICADVITRSPTTQRVVTEALRVFPELLFYSNWYVNKEHLLLNSTVYPILKSDLTEQEKEDPICVTIVDGNNKLLSLGRDDVGTPIDYIETADLNTIYGDYIKDIKDMSIPMKYLENKGLSGKLLLKSSN